MRLVRECMKCGHEEDFRSGPIVSCPTCGGGYFRNSAKIEKRKPKKEDDDSRSDSRKTSSEGTAQI